MKLIVRRAGILSGDVPSDEVTGPIVLYGIDGDGVLYFHKYDPTGKRIGGGAYAEGCWSCVEESAPVEPQFAERWRKMQAQVAEDPNVPPKW